MKKSAILIINIILLIIILPSNLTQSFVKAKSTENKDLKFVPIFRWNPRKITIKYDMIVKNNDDKTVNITTYLAKPKSSFYQKIHGDINYNTEPDGFLIDKWGQEVAYYNYQLVPNENISFFWQLNATLYSVRYLLFPWSVRDEIPQDIMENYTCDTANYKINDPFIQDIIDKELKYTHNLLFKSLKLHKYIINNIEYVGDDRWDDAVTVLKRGNGSCSEYCYAFIALCRAAGIPARYNGGTIFKQPAPHVDTRFHRITELYFPNYGWVPIDPTWDDYKLKHYFFGLHVNTLFTLTVGGGPSDYLNWSYHYWQDVLPYSDKISVQKSFTWEKWERPWYFNYN